MKDARFAKFVVALNAATPMALLVWDAMHHDLGANPPEYVEHTTGMLALICLLLSLSVTPLRKITGSNWFSHFRRMLGLFAFFYAGVHLLAYTFFDQQGSLRRIWTDTLRRPYIAVGMIGFALMVPLAITSTNAMVRRLGAKNWKRLHKAAYFAGIAGALHYYLLVKADTRQPIAFAAVLTILLGYRIYLAQKPGKPATPTAA